MKTGKRKWMKGGSPERSGFDENLLKFGGPGGGAARRTSKKAKTNVSKTGKADSTASGMADAEKLYGDWLKKGGKPRKNMLEQVDKASRKNMKKMMKSPDYGKKFTFSKKLKKMVGLE